MRDYISNEKLTQMTAFHSQQAIEKSLKAVLEEKEAYVPKIHNIIVLKEKIKVYIDLIVNENVFNEINDLTYILMQDIQRISGCFQMARRQLRKRKNF